MRVEFAAVVVESRRPARLSQFWAQMLGCEATDGDGVGVSAVRIDDGVALEFVPATAQKVGKNRLHLDLATLSEDHQTSLVHRARVLGAHHVDIGQGTAPWVVLADPEGNEFCILDPREEYRDAGPIAAVVTDVSDPAAASLYWSTLMGAPIERTHPEYASIRRAGGAWLEFVRSPHPPPHQGRLHLRLITPADLPAAEPSSHSTRPACPSCQQPSTVLTDPGGNRVCLSQVQRSPGTH